MTGVKEFVSSPDAERRIRDLEALVRLYDDERVKWASEKAALLATVEALQRVVKDCAQDGPDTPRGA